MYTLTLTAASIVQLVKATVLFVEVVLGGLLVCLRRSGFLREMGRGRC